MILLPTPTAKLIVKELIRYDGLKTELIIKDKIIESKDSTILAKDDMISQHNKLVTNLNKELKNSQEQFKAQQKLTQAVEADLKKQKKLTYTVGGAGVLLGILIKILF